MGSHCYNRRTLYIVLASLFYVLSLLFSHSFSFYLLSSDQTYYSELIYNISLNYFYFTFINEIVTLHIREITASSSNKIKVGKLV